MTAEAWREEKPARSLCGHATVASSALGSELSSRH